MIFLFKLETHLLLLSDLTEFLDSSNDDSRAFESSSEPSSSLTKTPSPSPIKMRKCSVKLTKLRLTKMKMKVKQDWEAMGRPIKLKKIVPKFRIVGRVNKDSAKEIPTADDMKWVQKPKLVRLYEQNPERVSQRTRAFIELLSAKDAKFDVSDRFAVWIILPLS